jgi:uncharacterized protein (DUF1778 family)
MKRPFVPELLSHKDVKWELFIPLIGKANRALAELINLCEGRVVI